MRKNKHVDFIGIGAQKAGTSWLFRRLEELPEFSLPPIKELHYFDRQRKYDSPHTLAHSNIFLKLINYWWLKNIRRRLIKSLTKGHKENTAWFLKYFFSSYDDNFYLELFENLEGIKGEVSPSYSLLEVEDIQKIHQLLPHVKLILLLRDPIDRAWSHYNYVCPKKDILNLDRFKAFINSPKQEERSNYLKIIEKYHRIFPSNQLFIAYFDQIKENPKKLLEELVSYLGGDASMVAKHCQIETRNNVNKDKLKIPNSFLEVLKEKYQSLIMELAKSEAEYPKRWQKRYFE